MILTTLSHFLIQQIRDYRDVDQNLGDIIKDIAIAGKLISKEINKAGLTSLLGEQGKINVQGETVQKLDEFTNQILIKVLHHSGKIACITSEENDDIVKVPNIYPKGEYIVNLDPLDGSSNLDVNVSVGTIFSIFKRVTKGKLQKKDYLQKGDRQVAAGYILYGSSTMLVYTLGHGVDGFTLDSSVGEFILSNYQLKLPDKSTYYSINEGYSLLWSEKMQKLIISLKTGDRKLFSGHSLRYIGSAIADFHRNLLKGGIFLYPSDRKHSQGKLRLLFEAFPLAFLIQQSGGISSDGRQSILEITPTDIHQRTPLFLGNKVIIKYLEKLLK